MVHWARRRQCRACRAGYGEQFNVVTGTVKWFDPDKGYGFIQQDGGGQDLFVHRSAVGYAGLNEGDRVEYDLGYGPKGQTAAAVRVTEPSALPPRPRRSEFGARDGFRTSNGAFSSSTVDVSGLPLVTGTVKRYDAEKGFGFIARDGGGDDVFVHRSALGYETVGRGDRVEFRLGQGPKGARAEQVRVIERVVTATGGHDDWSRDGYGHYR
jgi:CspA family cold shock protein